MSNSRQEFSGSGSQEIQRAFANAIVPIEEALNNVKAIVDTLHDWWKGDSATAFVEVSEEMRNKVHNELNEWLMANQRLIQTVERVKFGGEDDLSNSIKAKA